MKTFLPKRNLTRALLLGLVFLLLGISESFGQTYDDMRVCPGISWNCSAKEFTLNRIFLTDTSGVELTQTSCSYGDPIMVEIRAEITANATRYDVALYSDLRKNDDVNSDSLIVGFSGTVFSGTQIINFGRYNWTCGDKFQLLNTILFYSQNTDLGRIHTCSEGYTGSKCKDYSDIVFDINAPLSVGYDYTACNNGNDGVDVTFTPNVSGGSGTYTTYNWEFFSNGISEGTSSTENPSHTFNGDAPYTASLIVVDDNNTTNTPAYEETLVIPKQLTATSIETNVLCDGTFGTTTITVLEGTPGYEYSKDGINFQSSNILGGFIEGDHTITIRDANSCTITKIINIDADECCTNTVSAGLNFSVCEGADINLTATFNATADSFKWIGPNGIIPSVQNPIISNATLLNEGEYIVTAFYNNGSCEAKDTVNVTIKPTSTGTETHDGCEGDEYSVTVNGNVYDESNPTGTEVLTNSVGCDSTITINLVYKPTYTANETTPVIKALCEADFQADGFTWGDSTWTEAGSKNVVFQTVNGCDSIVTVTLNINDTYTANETTPVIKALCEADFQADGFTWGDSTWTEAGSKNVVFQTVNGCDSIVTVTLNINDTYTANETTPVIKALCEADFQADGFTWGDSTWTEAGSKNVVFQTVNGCDSIVTVTLNINDTYTANETTPVIKALCEADFQADGFTWGDSTWTEAGSKNVVFQTVNGCDSIVTVTLNINDTYTANETTPVIKALCEADFQADGFTWGDSTWTEAGSKNVVFQTVNGCDSIVTVTLNINDTYTANETTPVIKALCEADFQADGFTWGDSTWTEAGSKNVVFQTVNGCDSIVTVTLNINDTYTANETTPVIKALCEADFQADGFTWGDSTWTEAGSKNVVFQTVNGCDSIVTVTLNINDTYTANETTPVIKALCEADFQADGFTWGDSTWTEAGSKNVVFQTVNGCDSIVTVTLNINDTYTANETTPVIKALCEADFQADGFTWGDSTWTEAGSKNVVFQTVNGCDSIVTVTLNINDTYTANETTPVIKALCEADFQADGFTWGDSTWTEAGSKNVVFQTVNGCDSIVTVTLNINDTYTANETTPVIKALCEADFQADGFTWGDSTWTEAGSKNVVFQTVNGCDSIVTVTLNINDTYTANETTPVIKALCEADFQADGFTWGDSTWTEAGSKNVVFQTVNGCDSIVTVTLNINDTYTANETTPVIKALCEADFQADGFTWGDSTWTEAGSKNVVFQTVNGCDSIVTVTLNINDTYTANETTPVIKALCEADFQADGFTWGDSTWTEAGSKNVVFQTVNGCDSIVTVTLNINDTYTANETTPVIKALCEADFQADGFTWGDSTWTEAGSKNVVFQTVNGCDSIVTVTLNINDTYTANETTPVIKALCEADFQADGFTWGDSTWTEAGSKNVVFQTVNGCDSIVTVTLNINDTYTANETTPVIKALCEADFQADGFTWGDSTWTEAGSKNVVFQTVNGCDSIVTVTLNINDTYTANETTPVIKALCEADFQADGFTWGDSTWTEAGSKNVVFQTVNGCDSIVTVTLNINDTYTANETTPVIKALCEADFQADGFTWGDSTWTEAGSKNVVFQTVNGCDSIVTVTLNINDTYTANETTPVIKALCEADFQADGFTWGDSTWTEAGSKNVVFQTVNGCDSIVTVTLNINDTYTANETTPVIKALCEADFQADGFTWGDSTWTEAGSKNVVFQTVNGCDSIVTVTLNINDTYTANETTPVIKALCEADFQADGFTWGDSTWTEAGSKNVVFQTVNGCDSIVTVTLNINDTYTANETTPVIKALCEADFQADGFTWGDSTWTEAGSKNVVFQTVNGCDSIVTVTLNINDTYTANETTPVIKALCEADFQADGFTWGDSTWTEAGSKNVVFQTVNGCDSIVTVTLNINDTYTANETTPVIKALCEADFQADGFTWGDSTWTEAGSKNVVFQTVNGCDSIVTVTLNINDTYTANETTPVIKALCEADFQADGFTWGDSTWTEAGSKNVVFQTVNGCDSIVTVTLNINDTYTANETTPVIKALCEADFQADGFTWGDSTWTEAGSKNVVFQTVNGCDSIVTVTLNINDTYTANETTPVIKALCEADFQADGFTWGDSTWTEAGSKNVVFQTVNGCDSIVTVTLNINDTYTANETTPVIKALCEADFQADGFTWGDSTWTEAGSKNVVFQTVNGCDSIVTVTLNINDTYTANETTPVIKALCEADFQADGFTWGDSTWTEAGSKNVVFQTVNGCDSIVTVTLNINDTYTANETTPVIKALCEADFQADGFTWGDSTWTEAGSKNVVFQTVNGCDSIVTVTLNINDTYTANETTPVIKALCEADFQADGFTWGDSTWTEAGSKNVVFQTVNGCDSIVTVTLNINDTYTANETTPVIKALCEADFQADGFTWGDSTWTEAGSKNVVFQTVNGCDSIVTVTLNINDTYTANETTPVIKALCEADFQADGFTWGDSTWTEAGSKNVVFQTVNGCDSIVTVTLNINDTYTANETTPVIKALCEADFQADGFTWGDSTWTEAGSKNVVFQTVNGCDSIVTVTLNINDTYTANETTPVIKALCEADFQADGFTWGDSTWTEAGSKNVVFQTVNGCDSIVTVTLNINDTYTANETTPVIKALCEADFQADGFTWGDSTWTEAGSKNVVFQTVNGCDSIVTVTLNINDTYTANETTPVIKALCEADFQADGFTWGDSTWTEAGSKNVVFQTVNGCDSIVTVTLNINDTYTANETTPVIKALCEADFQADGFTWGDSTWTEAGSKNVVFQTVNGCDSIVTVRLTVNLSTKETIYPTGCEIITVNEVDYTESGTYTQNLVSTSGCDSTLTIVATVLENNSSEMEVTQCGSYIWNGTTYTQSGTYMTTYVNSQGCDSIVTLKLTILESGEETITRTECDTYTLNEIQYTESGTYTQVLENENGCDLVITLNLTITQSTEETIELSGCDEVTVNEKVYTTSGTYTQNLTNATGCDSTLIIEVTILEPTAETIQVEGCETVTVNDSVYATSGTYTQNLTNDAGCDSTLTIEVTILESTAETIQVEGCETVTVNDSVYTNSGTYTQNLSNTAGCDSTLTVQVTILEPTAETIQIEGCEMVTVNDSVYTNSGTYTQNLSNTAGCDSTLTIIATILNSTEEIIEVEGCDSIVVNNTQYYTSGNYTQKLINTAGCDSTLTIIANILNSNSSETEVTQCGSYTWNGTTYTQSGTYMTTFVNSQGCDSIVTLRLTILESGEETITRTECDTYTLNEIQYTESGTYTQVLENENGCDLVITLNLTITQSTEETIELSGCDEVTVNEKVYTTSGTYTQNLTSATGCDSTLIIEVTILEPTAETIQVEGCETVTVNDSVYTNSGTYTQNLMNTAGCDSTLTVQVTILEPTAETIQVEGCETVTVNEAVYTTSGTYTQNLTNVAGCDSTLTVLVTILEATTETIQIEGCETVTVNDSVYTTSGSYTQNLTNVAGCDSTLTVLVTILEPTTETIQIEGCETVTVNDSVYTASGSYTQNLTNVAGCDSTLTIEVTILEPTTETIQVEGCETVTVNDSVYTTSGTYTQNLTNAAGCDSTLTIVATILETTEETIVASDCQSFTINDETYTETGVYTQQLTNNVGCDSILTINVTIGDTIAPTAICSDLTVQLDANGLATISLEDIENGSTDNCSIDTMFIDKTDFTCDNVGTNEVTLTVIDANGNEGTCTATVTVETGDADCGQVRLNAVPDLLTLVVCPGGEISGNINLLANDEGIGAAGVSMTASNLPDDVQLDITSGELLYTSENLDEAVIQFTYTICSNANETNCDTAEVTIIVLRDTDCDGVPDNDDIDDDDDGILDIFEQENPYTNTNPADGDIDTDGDGIVDRLDIDSDDDGIVDNIEWQQNIPEGQYHASEFDGVDLEFDYYPPLGVDSDDDGWDDRYDDNENGGQNIFYLPFDMDLDGIPDFQDPDADGDDIPDYIEGHDALPHDSIVDAGHDYTGTDSDNDGLDDAYDTYDTSLEWLHGRNAIGSNAPLQDMAGDTTNNIRDWRDIYAPPTEGDNQQATGCELNIPDGFSPNDDNYNDYFKVEFVCAEGEQIFGEVYPSAKIEIFNRWGNLVYEKERYGNTQSWGDYEAWWDGRSTNDLQVGNDKLPAGTYFYILYFNDGGKEPVTGSIFLNN